jgi:GntP family gluconate:H+ symporter
MHPPFGFALFYLRSVAPSKEYTDKLTRKPIAPVTTMQIYWGAVPFVLIQVLMVGLIIAFPGIVSRDKEEKVDLDKVKIEMPSDVPGAGSNDPLAPPSPDLQPAPAPGTPEGDKAAADADKAAADEQKKIDDLFKK